MNVASPLVSDCQASEAIEPGKASFDHPSMPAELFFTLNAPGAMRGAIPRVRQSLRQRGNRCHWHAVGGATIRGATRPTRRLSANLADAAST
jgi:hypothetical protein